MSQMTDIERIAWARTDSKRGDWRMVAKQTREAIEAIYKAFYNAKMAAEAGIAQKAVWAYEYGLISRDELTFVLNH